MGIIIVIAGIIVVALAIDVLASLRRIELEIGYVRKEIKDLEWRLDRLDK